MEEGRVHPGTRWAPTIITHEQPDWDSLVSVFLVQRLVDDGDFPAFAGALVSYASDVDQGHHALVADDPTAFLTPHLGYLAIQHLKDVEGQLLMEVYRFPSRCWSWISHRKARSVIRPHFFGG